MIRSGLRLNGKALKEIGEFGLIDRIRDRITASNPDLIKGIGDDVAVIEIGGRILLATTDLLIEGIHFDRSWIDPYRLGKKALSVNLSDIAAMGGIPRYFLISLGLPNEISLSFVSLFYRGLKEEAKRYQVDLVGGDTSVSRHMLINICLLGEGKKGDLIFRKGARVGDDIFVSGTLGDSALGLRFLKNGKTKERPKGLIERHLSPSPRIELGQAIARNHLANAMIDISDGLLIDTSHLLKESGVGARIWEDRIPLSISYRKWISHYSKNLYKIALTGGEDYELLFTARPKNRNRILKLAPFLKIPITLIGKIIPKKEGFQIIRKDGREYFPHHLGFEHFK